jgi:hypothetical protein
MRNATREYLRRYPRLTGVVFMIVGTVLAAIFLPQSAAGPAMAALIVLFSVYFAWATTVVPKQPNVTAPSLTIRDHFKRTRGLFVRIGVPVVCAWCVGVELYPSTLTKGQRQAWAIAGGVVLMFAATLFIKDRFKCPRCGTNFKHERWAKLGRWSMDMRNPEEMWDSCPHCGVSFNERYSG